MRYVGLSGSLRRASINSALLRVASRLAPAATRVDIYDGMARLPLFNPDLEPVVPEEVVRFRSQVGRADALIVASPEYAHGITGVMKNALDWLVSHEAFVAKPVAVLNASPRAHHADSALREVLRTMSAQIVEDASVSIPLLGSGLSEEQMAESQELRRTILGVFAALEGAVSGGSAAPSLPIS